MISDVLFDAVASIEEYERNLPACYAELRAEIAHVKATMDALRQHLDGAPGDPKPIAWPEPPK
jgi:ribosome-associated toxin RatA of RatAB toxin-antitoxin module